MCLVYIKIDQLTRLPRGMIGASQGLPSVPVLSLPLISLSYAHLRPFKMSGAHVFSNAHDIVVSGCTFYTADTVSGRARYPPSKLIA